MIGRRVLTALLPLPLAAGCGVISWFTDTDPTDGVGYRWVRHADEEEAWTGEWRRVSSGASVVLHQGHGDPVSIWEQPVGAECER